MDLLGQNAENASLSLAGPSLNISRLVLLLMKWYLTEDGEEGYD
jgi:hypothetical protein